VNDQKILQRVSIENLLTKLPAGRFLRVHRSFVVNLCCVDRWSSTKVIVSGVTIPIGRTRRDEVVRRLKEMKG
jgi:DNA-binding LytR/AlgR family response regulator